MEMWRNLFQDQNTVWKKLWTSVAQPEGADPLQALVLLTNSEQAGVQYPRVVRRNPDHPEQRLYALQKLEQAGFLYRVRSKADERVVTLSVTPAGCGALEPHFEPAALY